jgi:endonuclease/exonuclease/phosphatase family metal-dependent hydrolase
VIFNAKDAKGSAKERKEDSALRPLRKTWRPLRLSLSFFMIASSSLAMFAQKPPANSNDHLLESGHAAKTSTPATAPTEIKIVSYNIRWRSGKELEQIVDWLKGKESPPAIIGLQEVDRAKERTGKTNNARVLAESLGMYYAWAAPPLPKDSKEKEEETGVELLSLYPLTDITRIVLPHEGPGGRWRIALGATVKIGKTAVRVYSVHSETRIPVSQKLDQLRAVLDDLARFPKTMPAAVMGDFNSWELPTIEGIRKLFEGSGFLTPFSDDETTFRRKALVFDVALKLDWIWLRGLSVKSSGIDRSLTVSDHFPLWTVVRFAKE